MNPNSNCECTGPGDCARHGVKKSRLQFNFCAGIGCTPSQCASHFAAWEAGKKPGQTAPVADPKPAAIAGEPLRRRGLGDFVADGIHMATFGFVKPCGGCSSRQAILNHWFPASRPPIEPVNLGSARRHLAFHLWPLAGNGVWQWHCDQLLRHASLFNGRRVVAIVESPDSDRAATVIDYLRNFTDQFVVLPNDKKLREVTTWLPLLNQLQEFNTDQDVTFYGQGKGVRRNIRDLNDPNVTIFRWTKAMYEMCFAWDRVRPILEKHGCAGSFRRNSPPQPGSWGPWHYSGTFYWFRNRDAFRRNWQYVPHRFYGTEAWPGNMFHPDEAGVIACDDIGDLYQLAYWNQHIEPQLEKWRAGS
jgi:hypothetical protein